MISNGAKWLYNYLTLLSFENNKSNFTHLKHRVKIVIDDLVLNRFLSLFDVECQTVFFDAAFYIVQIFYSCRGTDDAWMANLDVFIRRIKALEKEKG